MKRIITTIQNIFKIDDLRIRIINTLLFLLVYRVGSYIVLPGVDPTLLSQNQQDGILGILNLFAGGSFSRASIFALGVMPYISASIVIQILGIAIPFFQRLQKEGESGRKKLNQYTRILTIVITLAQAVGYVKSQIPANAITISNGLFTLTTMVILTAGTMFVMWLGEKITDRGLGNGTSLIIMAGIIAGLPLAFVSEGQSRLGANGGGMIPFIVEIAALIGVVMAVILLVQGTRKIAVQYAKRIVGNKQYGGVRQYIPLKVNSAGVMPIIFAQAIMIIPGMLASFMPDSAFGQWVGPTFGNPNSFWYNTLFALMIIAFTYFYTAIMINPNQMSDDMKRNGGFVPGVKPGRATAAYIDGVMSKITLPGSVFLALVAIMPSLASILGINSQFARFFGGTSLLIMVGVILDTLQQIESYLLNKHYDGLMKEGRIKGRQTAGAAIQQ